MDSGVVSPEDPAPPAGKPYVVTGTQNGQVTVFSMDEQSGALTQIHRTSIPALSFIDFTEGQAGLLVGHSRRVTAYDLQLPAGELTARSSGETAGAGIGVSDDQTGQFVFVANFSQNRVSFLPYSGDRFGDRTEFNCNRPHQIQVHRNNRWVYVPCLGNQLAQFNLDANRGTLTPVTPNPVTIDGGPRHLAFHPTLNLLYLMLEVDSAVAVFDINPETGALVLPARQQIPSTVSGRPNWSSDIHITPNGRWLYAFNRDNQELAQFAVDTQGEISFIRANPMNLGTIRRFAMDPKGKFMILGTQMGNLSTWQIDDQTGDIERVSELTGMGNLMWTGIRYFE